MKRSWAVSLAFLFLLPGPVASGEEVQESLFVDSPGDVEVQSADGSIGQPTPTGAENLDLVGGGVWAETDDTLTFFLQVKDLTENSQGAPFMDPDYTLDFRYHDQGYRVSVITALGNPVNDAFGRDATQAWLQKEVGPERYQNIADADAVLDFTEERVLVTVPRDAVVDQNQAPLGRNATLSQFRATASSLGFFSFPLPTGQEGGPRVGLPRFFDAAPDGGFGADYVLTTGKVDQRGSLFAVSDDPIRWTNGEATTLTFHVRLTNTGTKDIPVQVATRGVEPSWQIAYSDALTVGPGKSVNATLLATIPFVHNHGLLKLFDATFQSPEGEHYATARLGVYWAETPQPAGHHDTVWFHSAQNEVPAPFNTLFAGTHGWFNAKEEVEGDEAVPVPAQFAFPPGPFTQNRGVALWGFSLEPSLRMGLDFLLDEQGQADIALRLPVPVVDAHMEIQLYSVQVQQSQGPGQRGFTVERTLLAEGASAPLAGAVSGDALFEVPLQALPEADLIPYGNEGNLYVQILLDATFLAGGGFLNPESIAPSLEPQASKMRLPLEEYHDPVDLGFQTDGSLKIQAGEDGQERLVNPGRTVVYTFELIFDGNGPATFNTHQSGANPEWAAILGDQSITLEPGTTRTLAVAVTAPADARAGDVSDVTLRLVHKDNAAIQAGINLRTVVTTSEDIPDEADRSHRIDGELTKDRDSPMPSPLLLLAALVAVVLQRRR